MEFELRIDANALRDSLDKTAEQFEGAFAAARNMIASMMLEEVREEILSAGKFGEDYLAGVSVHVDDESIITEIDAPGAEIFATGGTITGNPLLWLPISGTDAEGVQAKNYGDKLFSVNRKSGVPLLFSMRDHAPKYFGVPSVTIPQKFDIEKIQERVMGELPQIIEDALRDANG